MVWRARRRARMGWHISRRPRWSSFDLDIGDREAHVIDPFVPRGSTKWEDEFLPPGYSNAGRPSLSGSSSRSYRKGTLLQMLRRKELENLTLLCIQLLL